MEELRCFKLTKTWYTKIKPEYGWGLPDILIINFF